MIAMPVSAEQLRLLNSKDLTAAFELSAAAGWNQTVEDWAMLVELLPEGCFGIEVDRRLVSTTTLVCYGQRLAWIGMVLTNAEYRGRGFARRLLGEALDRADAMGVETIKLDATDQGRPLYEKMGFSPEQAIERWTRVRSSVSRREAITAATDRYSTDLDCKAFGTDRSALLGMLLKRNKIYSNPNGFLFSRDGRTTGYLGPCVASNRDTAQTLISELIDASPQNIWSWDLLPANRESVAIASELGFVRQRCLTRMTRGRPLHQQDHMVYAIAGFELG
jgi:GNAT superfamily N-acetyltransferase